jgi:hypothetical protein
MGHVERMEHPYMMTSAADLKKERKARFAIIWLRGAIRWAMAKLQGLAVYATEDFEGDNLVITITVKLSEQKPCQVIETRKEPIDNDECR